MFLYFLLVSGDSFLRRLVEVLPRFASKRQAVDISQQIESDISAYLLTITLMNALVGATALVMWATGVGDPVLWGTLAFLLNYVPMLGPAAATSFSCSRLAHDPLGLARPAPGGALQRHPSDRGRDGDADASRQAIHAQSRSRGLLFRVLAVAVGCPGGDPLGAIRPQPKSCAIAFAARGSGPHSLGLKATEDAVARCLPIGLPSIEHRRTFRTFASVTVCEAPYPSRRGRRMDNLSHCQRSLTATCLSCGAILRISLGSMTNAGESEISEVQSLSFCELGNEKVMDKDRVAGSAKQVKGAVKEAVGKVVGDAKLKLEGKADKVQGKVQNAVGGLKDAVRDAVKT